MMPSLLNDQVGTCLTCVGLLGASLGVTSRWTRHPTGASDASSLPGTSWPSHSTKKTLAPSLTAAELLLGCPPPPPPPPPVPPPPLPPPGSAVGIGRGELGGGNGA